MVHGCQRLDCQVEGHFPDTKHPFQPTLTYQEVYVNTLERLETLKSKGFLVRAYWEHDIAALSKKYPSLKQQYSSALEFENGRRERQLTVRSALKGGRTEPLRALVELTDSQIALGWRIEHLDITSMASSFYILLICRPAQNLCLSLSVCSTRMSSRCFDM